MSRTAAILLAAGQGRRMQAAATDKILAILAGRPVFAHSAATFIASGVADFYVIVYRDACQSLELSCYAPTPALFVKGGRERQDSVANALEALPDDIRYVFIHDCARPLVQPEQLSALLRMVHRDGAAAIAHRVVDTIKQVPVSHPPAKPLRPRTAAPVRTTTLDRTRLWAMETPQVFERELIVRAYAQVKRRRWRITDDVQAIERLGARVGLLENQHPNPKLTVPDDLAYLEFLLHRSASPST
jgi:2-C-methyl-D-erythritol 4-phosphate cytidylyltransferase